MKLISYIFCSLAILLISATITDDDPVMPPDVLAEYKKINGKLDYNMHVKPILSDKCFACHGPDKAKQKAGLRLDQSKVAFAPLPESPGKYAIKPGNLVKSEVYHRIISSDPEYVMPTPGSHLSLTAKEKAILLKWIDQGAEYKPHWAFVKPIKKNPPNLDGIYGYTNPIDGFVRATLKDQELKPAKQASKELLLRRLTFDLTGLPPTIQELDSFLADNAPDAYEKQVERLLNSKNYGERMAVDWLDLARFADSHGYTVDRLRDMTPYRDWVINAFNDNMPYNQFITEQLAGDLMQNPTRSMLIATAFNRNHQQNLEGGIVEEEFQAEYVMDRTNTFGEAFMAMSVGCARCHDHKYDPISQKNYYEIYSFFNNVLEAGQISWNDDIPTPALPLPTDEQERVIETLKKKIADQEQKTAQVKTNAKPAAEAWISKEEYRSLLKEKLPSVGLKAVYGFDGDLTNQLDTAQKGEMKHDAGAKGDLPVFTAGRKGQALALNGDIYLDLNKTAVFRKSEPFTIGVWVWIPKRMKDGVIFHKSEAERLYNFKGFNVSLKNNKFEITMAHTAPSNAIIRASDAAVPREKWIHLSLAYDGSSKAKGFDLYVDGEKLIMEDIKDKLYKDIIFFRKDGEPGLQVGGWWRGTGFKDGKVDDLVVYDRLLTDFEIKVLADKTSWSYLAGQSPAQLTTGEKNILSEYFISAVSSEVAAEMSELKSYRTELSDSMRNVKEIMVMEEMPKPKKTNLFVRGQYNLPGEQVFPGTPADILPFASRYPKNRLGLAMWLTDPEHPLTARVAMNRLWQQFFGMGLVKTSEDFGNQGALPSHPELLDWLAVTFRESRWDIKHMIRMIVTSDTYKQDSYASPAVREADPENRLLTRGPASRLTAEMIRDNALAASGLLNTRMGGESIYPYQPAGLWEINSASYKADSTDAMYRRSIYIVAKRTVPNPTLATFDASERSSCLSRRQRTNTPLQALVTLNDPTFVEAAKVLGENMTREKDANRAITEVYRKLTARNPTVRELEILKTLQQKEWEKFKANPSKAKGWLETGIYKPDPGLEGALVAANTVVASTIMNSDATITKR
ncbi:MAG TPA: DUF1553 domain-containing protein [Chitinophagaceae bacterium]|nr:DUF1553 domain-containing protein [Chitinophagaceae bacterium]